MAKVVIFDLETGGVEMSHPVIQLAAIAVDVDTLAETSAFEAKLKFDVSKCDPKALEVNHYDPSAWASAMEPSQVVQRFSAWLRPHAWVPMVSKAGKPYSVAMLAGYNAVSFDLPRLRALYGTSFFPCAFLVRDVLQRALFYFDERRNTREAPQNFKLSTIASHFGVNVDGAHDALTDCRLTAGVWRAIRKEDR